MKKSIIFLFIILVLIIFSLSSGCDHRSEKQIIAHKVIYKTAKILLERHQLKYIGMLEEGDANFYKRIGIHFQILRVLDKDEGRKILMDSIEVLLNEINSDLNLKPYLNEYPFTVNNIEIEIFTYFPDAKFAYYPNIGIFSLNRGQIKFLSLPAEKSYGYASREVETYEEALKIIKTKDSED